MTACGDSLPFRPGSVIATVNNVFEPSSTNETRVDEAIQTAIGNATSGTLLADATFDGAYYCVCMYHCYQLVSYMCNILQLVIP